MYQMIGLHTALTVPYDKEARVKNPPDSLPATLPETPPEVVGAVETTLRLWVAMGNMLAPVEPLHEALKQRLAAAGFLGAGKDDAKCDMPAGEGVAVFSRTQIWRHPDSPIPFAVISSLRLPWAGARLGKCTLQACLADMQTEAQRKAQGPGVLAERTYLKSLNLSSRIRFAKSWDWQDHIQQGLATLTPARINILADDAMAHLENCASA